MRHASLEPFKTIFCLKRQIQNTTITKRPKMATEKNLASQARDLLYKRGQKGLDRARQIMLQEKIFYKPLQEAIEYFMASWEDVLHPALLSLSCEAVGGNSEATVNVAAALVLLAGAADLHDDVIDQSTLKDSKPTVFGKYGKDLTVLSGEILMFKGLYALHEACDALPANQKQSVLEQTKQAFLGISSAEAKESGLHGRIDVAEEYLDMIKLKSSVSEATMKIGATIGEGTREQVEALGLWGKTFGILFTLRDEFIDIFEVSELENRYANESLPLPVLLAMKDEQTANSLKQKLENISEEQIDTIVNLVMDSAGVNDLKKEMVSMKEKVDANLQSLNLNGKVLELLLDSTIEDL
jgi:octaprenyl-diphosphate synthase